MLTRVLGVLAVLLTCVLVAGPAVAVEEAPGEEAERPTLEELGCTAEEGRSLSCPEEVAPPLFFRWMWGPLLVIGLIAAGMALFRYLQWQPRFAREREEKLKSRR